MLRNCVGNIFNFVDKFINWLGDPGCFPLQHFIEDDSYCPDVALWSIGISFQYFTRHVKRGADRGLSLHFPGDVSLGKSEISDFDDSFGYEDISWFDVPDSRLNYLWMMPSFMRAIKPFTICLSISIAFCSSMGAHLWINLSKSLSHSSWTI